MPLVMPFDFYDPIGNRTSATDYDEQGNPLVSSYSANALNQIIVPQQDFCYPSGNCEGCTI